MLFFLAKQGFLSHFSFVDTKAFYPPFNSCKEMQKNKNRFFHALYTLSITSSFRLISNPFAHLKILKP